MNFGQLIEHLLSEAEELRKKIGHTSLLSY